MAARTASRSVTSSRSASASSPRSRIACAAASISACVRAASVTWAPACASAEAAASPMPRPPPVTSARLPSRRKDAVFASAMDVEELIARHVGLLPPPLAGEGWGGGTLAHLPSFRCLRVADIAAAVAPHAHIGLLGMSVEAFENAQPRAMLADQRRGFVGEHLLIGTGLEKLADPEPAGIARRLSGRQRVVGPDHLVAIGDIGARPEKERSVILHPGEEVVGIARHHLHVLGGDAIGLTHHLV